MLLAASLNSSLISINISILYQLLISEHVTAQHEGSSSGYSKCCFTVTIANTANSRLAVAKANSMANSSKGSIVAV